MTVRIIEGDCREILRTLPDASVDSIVTDPPYELGFMGVAWDSTGVAYDVAMWRECLRVLKPGGHLLSFGGSRTYHRMACAIEDAGFDIRDQIMWIYGSGFPKSLNIAKAIDRFRVEDIAPIRVICRAVRAAMDERGYKSSDLTGFFDNCNPRLIDHWAARDTDSQPTPVVVARKPFPGTVTANVQLHGTGAMNIDACLIGDEGGCESSVPYTGGDAQNAYGKGLNDQSSPRVDGRGRWPANVMHDGSDEVVAAFPLAPGQQSAVTGKEPTATGFSGGIYGEMKGDRPEHAVRIDSQQSAARFFYHPKASRSDRNVGFDEAGTSENGSSGKGNHHQTVKPTDVMRWLVRLVTRPGGTVLDPFGGSGSTARAADIEGCDAILIEQNPEFVRIARTRIHGDAPLFANL